MMAQACPRNPWWKSLLAAFAGISLLAGAGSTAWAQITSSPVVDATLPAYPGARTPVAVQADGKLLITGDSFLVAGVIQKGVARLNADWSLDTGFASGTGADSSTITTIVVQPDQKILVGGTFTSFSGQAASGLVRLLPDGKIDPAFAYTGPGNVSKVLPLTNGEHLVIDDRSSEIRWHTAGGSLVRLLPLPESLRALTPPPPSYSVTLISRTITTRPVEVAELKDGTILAVFLNSADARWIRESTVFTSQAAAFVYLAYGTDGLPRAHAISDQTVDISSEWPLATTRIIPAPSGGYYIFHNLLAVPYTGARGALKRYQSDGTLDPGFTAPAMSDIGTPEADWDSAGKLIVAGAQFTDPAFPTDQWTTVRLLDNGMIDPRFGISLPGPTVARLAAIRKGTTPADDRIILHHQNTLIAFKPTNRLTLGPASALPATQAVTTGKNVSLTANAAGTNIQWQISTDGGQSWANLTDSGAYHGTNTPTLDIIEAGQTIANALFRYVSTTGRGAVSSNATTLTVTPLFFPFPVALGIDRLGELYVADTALNTIQKIDSNRQVSTVAGLGRQAGAIDGIGTGARFNQPGGVASRPDGGLMVCDTANGTVREITASGTVTTIAGSSTARGSADGPGAQALFSAPMGIARHRTGNFYVTDSSNHTIRMITPDGTVSTVAGLAGVSGASDGTGTAARFNFPTGIAVDEASGDIYVADSNNNLIRRITPAGVVTTVAGLPMVAGYQDGAGDAALFNQPGGLAFDNSAAHTGCLYVADTGNSIIRKITSAGNVTTWAGLPTVGGHKDGTGLSAWFNQPKGLVVADYGDIYVADTGNAAIRRIRTGGVVTTLELAIATTIVTQPGSLTVVVGGRATFTVIATGSGILAYQWQKDGVAIPGATAPSYSISSVIAADAGHYSVVISNAAGSVFSNAATLTVNAPVPSTPSTPSTPASGQGGGGGGGAPSLWFLGALSWLALQRGIRWRQAVVNNRRTRVCPHVIHRTYPPPPGE